MSLIAWLAALGIGITLGLTGSGGSILTLPVLVYLVGQDPKEAIASSLAIVGIISLFSAFWYWRERLIHWRAVVIFGLAGMLGAYLGAYLAHFLVSQVQMVIFALLMLLSAGLMLKPLKVNLLECKPHATWKMALEGGVVGIVTGLVGVGGGFLIIPALVILSSMPMHTAVGTSLVIITLNALTGFIGYMEVLQTLHLSLHWQVIGVFAAVGVMGGFVGQLLAKRINQHRLKQGFALLLLLLGSFVLVKNLF